MTVCFLTSFSRAAVADEADHKGAEVYSEGCDPRKEFCMPQDESTVPPERPAVLKKPVAPLPENVSSGESVPSSGSCSRSGGVDIATLKAQGYTVLPIAALGVMNASPDAPSETRDPKPFSVGWGHPSLKIAQPDGSKVAADLILNGTFFVYGKLNVMGPVMRAGTVDKEIDGRSKIYGRGGIAILQNGDVVSCAPGPYGDGGLAAAIQSSCSRNGVPVRDYMGGGATLIDHGEKACSGGQPSGCRRNRDLSTVQQFAGGIGAGQFRSTAHSIIAISGRQAYAVIPTAKSGTSIRNDLCKAGFSDVVKFDGGGGFLARGAYKYGGNNPPTGFKIKVGKRS